MEVGNRAMDALSAGHKDEATQLLLSPAEVSLHAVALAAADEDLKLNAREATTAAAAIAVDATRTVWINCLMTLAIVILSIIIGAQLNRFVTPRIRNVMEMVQRFAAKDMTAYVQTTASDEIGRMGEALNDSVAAIREVLRSVAQGADTLSAATTEISARAVRKRRQRQHPVQQDQPDRRRRPGNDRDHRRDQPQRRERRHRQPRLRRNRRPGRRSDAGRRRHHGKNCRRHPAPSPSK